MVGLVGLGAALVSTIVRAAKVARGLTDNEYSNTAEKASSGRQDPKGRQAQGI